jgi:hypothetical protein
MKQETKQNILQELNEEELCSTTGAGDKVEYAGSTGGKVFLGAVGATTVGGLGYGAVRGAQKAVKAVKILRGR